MAAEPAAGQPDLRTKTVDSIRALFVGIAGFLGGQVIGSLVAVLLVATLFAGTVNRLVEAGLATVGFGIGLVVVGALYLGGRGLDASYIDIRTPSLSDIGVAVGGLVGLFVVSFTIGIISQQIGVQGASSSIERSARQLGQPEIILVFVPLSWLVIGPAEELFYRNIVQKSLYDSFTRRNAVIVATVIFALVHIPQYFINPTSIGSTAVSIISVFVLALILGFVYERTRNLLVPIFIHGTWNAFSFTVMYVRVSSDLTAGVL